MVALRPQLGETAPMISLDQPQMNDVINQLKKHIPRESGEEFLDFPLIIPSKLPKPSRWACPKLVINPKSIDREEEEVNF